MRLLGDDEAMQWCQSRGLSVDAKARMAHWEPERGKTLGLTVPTGQSPGSMIAMARACLLIGTQDSSEPDFGGALVWLLDWDIWSDVTERAGEFLALEITRRDGDRADATLLEYPATLFAPNEIVAAQAFLSIPLLWGWDALVVPEPVRAAAFLSHDEGITIVSATQSVAAEMKRRFEA